MNSKRVWEAANGHKVVVNHFAGIDDSSTRIGRDNVTTNTFRCECGKFWKSNGNPKKAELVNHDSWVQG
jgi:hypothetical protein